MGEQKLRRDRGKMKPSFMSFADREMSQHGTESGCRRRGINFPC
jgi:hypothetical protein